MIKELLIIFLPALLIVLIPGILESTFCKGDCGYFTAIIAFPAAMFWIGISTLIIIIYESYKSRKYGYIWFSIFMVLLYIILSIIGFAESLFYILIIYLIGLQIIKFTYEKYFNMK